MGVHSARQPSLDVGIRLGGERVGCVRMELALGNQRRSAVQNEGPSQFTETTSAQAIVTTIAIHENGAPATGGLA